MEGARVKLTEVNPHLVCVLCQGYFVDATTIAECLHSFCRSCIFRQLERKSICPICETQVHNTKLYKSLKPDKTLQDIVYKLVPGLFKSEMKRRREFYTNHPYRDDHLEPECRGVGLDRLIYSPQDLISLSLEFYDEEREKEEWSNQGSPRPVQTVSSSGEKRYLQCPAGFKMFHLKKFLRQKYGLSPTCNIEIMYRRESLPDSYSLMDVAYIYTWKRNSPMRFYYKLPDIVMKLILGPPPPESKETELKEEEKVERTEMRKVGKLALVKKTNGKVDFDAEVNNHKVKVKEDLKKKERESKKTDKNENEVRKTEMDEKEAKKTERHEKNTKKTERVVKEGKNIETKDIVCEENRSVPPMTISHLTSSHPEIKKKEELEVKKNPPEEADGKENGLMKDELTKGEEPLKKTEDIKLNKPEEMPLTNGLLTSRPLSQQDELPVSVLLSLGQCRVNKEDDHKFKTPSPLLPKNGIVEKKNGKINSKFSVNRIASELAEHKRLSPPVPLWQKWQEPSRPDTPAISQTLSPQVTLNTSNGSVTIMAERPVNSSSPEAPPHLNGNMPEPQRLQAVHPNLPKAILAKPQQIANGKPDLKTIAQRNLSGQRLNNNLPEGKNGLIQQSNINNRLPTFQKPPGVMRKPAIPGAVISKTGPGVKETLRKGSIPCGVMSKTLDQRIQQLYNSGSPHKPPSPSGGKSESRLASWLNSRFPPQQSPQHQTQHPMSPMQQQPPPLVYHQQPAPLQKTMTSQNQLPKTKEESEASKLGKEVNMLKRKLEELRKGQEICEITQENPSPDELKRRRDVTPNVSIEFMSSGDMKRLEEKKAEEKKKEKRPVPGLKAIQELEGGGKRRKEEEALDLSSAKPSDLPRPHFPWMVSRSPLHNFVPRPS